MAEYRIVASVDPSGVTTGKNKVKQDLRDLDNAANTTKKNLTSAFDADALNANIGNLTQRIGTLETSLDRLVTSSNRVADGMEKVGRGGRGGAQGQDAMAAATRRVLQAVDQEAAELQKLNALLADATRLHKEGAITNEQYSRVQALVNRGVQEGTASIGQQRAGYLSLGQQVQDITQTLSLGINPLVVLAQQGGQTASALQMALGEQGVAGRVAGFMAGPWGSLILASVTVLGMLGIQALDTGEDLESMVDQLKDDAKEANLADQANAAFGRTLEGVSEAIRTNRKALDQLAQSQKSAADTAWENAEAQKATLVTLRAQTAAQIETTRQLIEADKIRSRGPGQASEMAALSVADRQRALASLEASLEKIDADITGVENDIANALSRRAVEQGMESQADTIRRTYDDIIEATRVRLVAEKATAVEIRRQTQLLRDQRDEKIKAAQQEQRTQADGVSRFRTQQQAIGIAGRELQGAGLRVDGNHQFGYTSGHANDADHNRNAIDVNVGKGIVEANVPDLKQKFDELALLYQSRGFDVIWNGKRYPAGGNGPGSAAKGHRDHLHIRAPETIVGRVNQASTTAQALREAQAIATAAEQQRDFVDNVINQAATRGQPNNASTLQAQIDKTLGDFQRRFNRAANDGERQSIVEALTEADQREARVHFEENYIQPLERLRELQGRVGVEREILNAQLSESARLGRDLTESEAKSIRDLYEGNSADAFNETFVRPLERLEALQGTVGLSREVLNAQLAESARVGRELRPEEEEQIERSVRRGDALQREAALLEEIRGPLEDYQTRLALLNDLLARGEINQTQFNARVADLGASARRVLGETAGYDPTGRSYGDIADAADEQARYAAQLADFDTYQSQLLQMGVDYNALIESAHAEHVRRMNEIDDRRKVVAVQAAQSTAESLMSIAENSVGEQSAVYRAMFTASKAFAIADSVIKIQQGIANAMSLPFPANLAAAAAVAAQAASIVSNINAVTMQFADGGLVRGPGSGTSDSILARVSNGEYVVNAESTRRNLPLLQAINDNPSRPPAVSAPRPSAPAPAAPALGGGDGGIKIVNVLDPSLVLTALNSEPGRRFVLNVIEDNPAFIQRMANGG